MQQNDVQHQIDCLLCEADNNKARMVDLPGKHESRRGSLIHCVLVDEGYLTVAAHVDDHTKKKILNFEYVDFVRLIPQDRIANEEDQRLTFMNKGGVPYLVPAEPKQNGTISSFSRWDQAFKVFTDIMTSKYPDMSTELLQYGHDIFTTSQTYIWENVYSYDKDFRIHIS